VSTAAYSIAPGVTRAKGHFNDEVAGVPTDENLAEACIEGVFRRGSGIGVVNQSFLAVSGIPLMQMFSGLPRGYGLHRRHTLLLPA
jgi:hypothetical protein